jgi:hypothetical protein
LNGKEKADQASTFRLTGLDLEGLKMHKLIIGKAKERHMVKN